MKVNAHGLQTCALKKITIIVSISVNLSSHLPKQLLPTVPATTIHKVLHALGPCALKMLIPSLVKAARKNNQDLQHLLLKLKENALMTVNVPGTFAKHQMIAKNGLTVIPIAIQIQQKLNASTQMMLSQTASSVIKMLVEKLKDALMMSANITNMKKLLLHQ